MYSCAPMTPVAFNIILALVIAVALAAAPGSTRVVPPPTPRVPWANMTTMARRIVQLAADKVPNSDSHHATAVELLRWQSSSIGGTSRRSAESLAAPGCDVADLSRRLQVCMAPFFSWSGHDWSDAHSVHTVCSSICQSTLNGMTASEWSCIRAMDPALGGVLRSMCVQSVTGQYCGEPYAAMLIFSDCSLTSVAQCTGLGGCAVVENECTPNYAPHLMSRLCTPCLNVLVSALTDNGVPATSTVPLEKSMETMCVMHEGTYCANYMSDARWRTRGEVIGFSTAQVSELCTNQLSNQCFLKLNALAANFLDAQLAIQYQTCATKCRDSGSCNVQSCAATYLQLARQVRQFRAIDERICTTNARGDHCMALPGGGGHRVLSAGITPPVFAQCFDSALTRNGQCTVECTAVLAAAIDESWGCCVATVNEVLSVPYPVLPSATPWGTSPPSPVSGTVLPTVSKCGGLQPAVTGVLAQTACNRSIAAGSGTVRSLTLNIAWDLLNGIEGLAQDTLTSLALDLSARLAISSESGIAGGHLVRDNGTISIRSLTGDATSSHSATRYTFEIRAATQAMTAAAVAEFDKAISSRVLSLPLTYQTVSLGCASLGTCLSVGTLVNFDGSAGSGAANPLPAAAAAAVLIVMALLSSF